ncbi:hypothetical protein OS493_004614 [Desmophyllum pertusum]|uniref:Uncharacterized protein n=1 Tax=Desmophyllum pertusum TaxID=174260 RepID=A0A9W9ZHD6_9CNID|nr:hypothetical protein OS493_004614 [Desmophyllum pertusum]
MTEILWPLLCIGIFAVACTGNELCSKKKCTSQGQICVVTEHNRAECRCRDSCPLSFGKRVCGSDGITYPSLCHLDMTSCKLYTITMVSAGRCQVAVSLKVSPTHQSTQTMTAGKPGEIRCGIDGMAAQVLWSKVGMKHRLPFSRVLPKLKSKTLYFRRVRHQDVGKYVCRASSWSKTVEATVNVIIVDPKTMDTTVASNRVCNLEKLIGPGKDSSNLQLVAGDVCSLPKLPGVCLGYFPKWFYDSESRKCKPFIYGGCQGNANNFESDEECKKTCSVDVVCKLQPEVGRCKGYFPRYFYNHTSGQCDKFIYGGCEGNNNRFHTLELCQKKCQIASAAIVKVKPGRCPWRRSILRLCLLRGDTCQSDGDCRGDDKCCHDGCTRSCARPISEDKPGTCPKIAKNNAFCDKKGDMCDKDTDCPGVASVASMAARGTAASQRMREGLSLGVFPHAKTTPKTGRVSTFRLHPPENCSDTTDKCGDDSQCPGRAKCCATGCLQECITPPAKVKPGLCPLNDYIPPELCEVTEDECQEDEDCKGRDKCCSSGCNQECMTPPIEVKPGLCPTVDYIDRESCEVTTDECNEDVDCNGKDKCCATGCIKECVTPPIPPPPRNTPPPTKLHGQCPKPWKGLNGICDRRGDMCSDDKDCSGLALCCFNGCQKDCINSTDPIPVDKPGVCPDPWKGQDGICDRRGDMCGVDIDCDASEKCCFNGCQRDCVKPGKRSSEKPGQCPNPWKEQPCDRRGDMCAEDGDCDSGGKCCHNGCQKDCVKPVNLTKCQEEIQSALDKLASGPPLLGAFVPKCKPDGHYEDQQCHEMYCWCVGKNGLKLPGTTVRGPAVCLHRAKPGTCPKPWKGQEGFCDYRGDMCSHDSECAGEDDRCCFNGCQNDCVPPVGIKLCTKHHKAETAKHQGLGFVGGFSPSCKLNGDYEEVQCHGSTGYCWCVDKLGNELEGTRTRGKPNCTPSVGIKLCAKHKEAEAAKHQGLGFVGGFSPSCKSNGDYEEVQCHGSTGYCWCVDKLGNELEGTRVRGKPNCTPSGNSEGAGKKGTCPKPWKGLSGFCDKMGDECGMDFHCSNENEKCCFSGCQRICSNTTETNQKAETKPGQCPKPWLGEEGLCDRRGDMCQKDVDCKGSQICCFNGCQKDCVNPGLSTCQQRYEESFLFPALGRFVPKCKKGGGFQETQCHPSTGHCWCVDSYGAEQLGTRTRRRPNCTVPDPCLSTTCPYHGQCVPSKDRKSVECKCNIGCFLIYDPVCGTDGKTYGNECSMKSIACVQKKNVTVDYKGECEVVDPCAAVKCGFYGECDVVNGSVTCVCPGSGSRPSCGDEKEPVCGSDGEIYDNLCHLMDASCQQEELIRPALPEICEEEKVDSCANITCSHPLQKCKTKDDGKPVCSCTHLACPRILEPVCGDDGQSYHSKCTMDMLSCEANKIVFVDYVGQCEKDITSILVKTPEDQCTKVNCSHPIARCEVINKTATCVCPTIVTLELFLVCGSDGVTYPNPGTLDIASCNSGGAIEKVKDGKCKWDAETDQCQK